MPARRIRYRQNRDRHGNYDPSFGEMMMSEQTLAPAREAAREIAALATATQRLSVEPYEVDVAVPPVVLGGNPRVVAHVVGNDRLHAVEEFGSGVASQGRVRTDTRPQGGWSKGRRTLAQAGDAIIPLVTRTPE